MSETEYKDGETLSLEAWRYYKKRIDQLLTSHDYDTTPHPEALKTDVFNEIRNLPGEGGVTRTGLPVTFVYVDNNKEYINTFKAMYPGERAYLMDIRDLQFSSDRFDFIFDCSTIDHVPFVDVEDVILNYHRLLKPRGKLLLITWTHQEPLVWPPSTPNPEQYYHPQLDLESILEEYFTPVGVDDNIIPRDNQGGTLRAYTLVKP